MTSNPTRMGFANMGNSCFLNAALHLVGCVVSNDDHLVSPATKCTASTEPAQRLRRATLGLLFAARDIRAFSRGLYHADTIVQDTGYSFRTCIDTMRLHVMDNATFQQGDAVEAIQKILDLVTTRTFGHHVKQVQCVHDTLQLIKQLTCVVNGKTVNLGKHTLRDMEFLWQNLPTPRTLSMLAVIVDDLADDDGLLACLNGKHVDRENIPIIVRDAVMLEQTTTKSSYPVLQVLRGCDTIFNLEKYISENDITWRRTEQLPETIIVLRSEQSGQNTTIVKLLQEHLRPEYVSLTPNSSTLYNNVMLRRLHISVDQVMFCMISRHAFIASDGGSSKITQHVTPDLKIVMSDGVFHLRGMIYHIGDRTNHGHYIAAVWRPNNKWMLIDDDKAYDVHEQILSQERGHELFAAVYIRE